MMLFPGLNKSLNLNHLSWGAWVAQSVEHPTLDFGPGHDPRLMGLSPVLSSVLSTEPAKILSLSPSATPPTSARALYLKKEREREKERSLQLLKL